MSQRIKGQEVDLLIAIANAPQLNITDIRNFEVAFQFEHKSEGYLGETNMRRDEIFNGCKGRMEMHFENEDIFGLINAIKDRATRATPDVQINIRATLNFPNGQRPRFLFSNVFFGEVPMNFGSRTDYGHITLDFECSDYQQIG